MKFNFRLDFLIKHNKDQEKQALIEYMKSVDIVTQVENEITQSIQRVEKCREDISEAEKKGGSIGAKVMMEVDFIRSLGFKIEEARERLIEANVAMETLREFLIEAQRETKKVQMLKDKKHEEFKRHKKLKEQKEIDDMITSRFKRGHI